MIKFDVKNRFTGDVQFTAEIDCDSSATASIKLGLAVKWAVKNGANLTGANLTGANLTRANLTRANLTGANLTGANLTGANLTGANLYGTNLYGTNLYGAVKAFGYKMDKAPIYIGTEIYDVQVWRGFIKIGCEEHTYEEWMSFSDEEIEDMDDYALDWRNKWKPVIQQIAQLNGFDCEPMKWED